MSVVTIAIYDLNLVTSDFQLDFSVADSQIDDGRATAAYFTAFYVSTLVNQPEFITAAAGFGEAIKASMQEDGKRPEAAFPATVKLTLTDKDLDTGRYSITTSIEGGDPTGESLPTAAQIVAGYIRALLNRVEFRDACWAFAEEYAHNNTGAVIENGAFAPTRLPCPANDAATIAA